MQLKLSLNRPGSGPVTHLRVTTDLTVRIGDLARELYDRDPYRNSRGVIANDQIDRDHLTIRVDGPGPPRVLPPDLTLADAGLQSGNRISLVTESETFATPHPEAAPARIIVLDGPDAGLSLPLRTGANTVGRDPSCDVVVSDPMVSKRHARVNVTDTVEIIDLGSANGVAVGGDLVQRCVIRSEDRIVIGDSVLRVEHHGNAAAHQAGPVVSFNRSPYLDPIFPDRALPAPEPPDPPERQRFPVIAMVVPVLMAATLFLITRQAASILFVAFSPLLMMGSVIESRWAGRKAYQAALQEFHRALEALEVQLGELQATEVEGRHHEHPDTSEVVAAAHQRQQLLWCRRPDRPHWLDIRLGVGMQPSRVTVDLPPPRRARPEVVNELKELIARHATVGPVPVVTSLTASGCIGIAGPRPDALATARALLTQLVTLHSPAEVVVAALLSSETASAWEWLAWLPHTTSEHSPLDSEHLSATPGSCTVLVAELEELVAMRAKEASTDAPTPLPVVVVLVEDDHAVERSRVVDLAERGPKSGVHVIWIASSRHRLPAACTMFVEIAGDGQGAQVGAVSSGGVTRLDAREQLDVGSAIELALALAPVVDSGARVDNASDLPSSVSFLSHLGVELAQSPEAMLERWRQSGSLPDTAAGPTTSARDTGLGALVGLMASEPLVLDLRRHGPHALVGGTTGSGKSELLQSWIIGMAVNHSPLRVNFLLVDYKGGAAFRECKDLPHTVGLVTDLSPHLVDRVLHSLHAELRYREHLLNRKGVKDLVELERQADAETPPSLVIIVDEFAALVTDVPGFVDGVVDVAQRGRSLGLHLILATQRPAGVIKDNLRANTNLRLALRVADRDDSIDVVGEPIAAAFDPDLPGRAIAKIGPGRLRTFQTAYVGGWTGSEPPPATIDIAELALVDRKAWEKPARSKPVTDGQERGPNDLARLVENAQAAAEAAALPPPRRPWLPELADVYDLSRLHLSRRDDDLVFAVADLPDEQRQGTVSFHPDRDGNMAIFGTSGAGKSTVLQTLAIVAGLGLRGGPCHVYGLDFGSRGLQMIEPLPHVGSVIAGDDTERVTRLLRWLREQIDERARRYSRVRAATITEFRERADAPDEPRLLVLLDGIGAFRQAFEAGSLVRYHEMLLSIAGDGRPVGVHLVVTADRSAAIPSSLASVIQKRLVLRLAGDTEYTFLGAPADFFATGGPPGRGVIDGVEVQVAVLGGSPNVATQARAIEELAERMAKDVVRPSAVPIGRLPERVELASLPVAVEGSPVFGMSDETLQAAVFPDREVFLVAGPPQSGKTTTLLTLAQAITRIRPEARMVLVTPDPSPIGDRSLWKLVVTGEDNIAELAPKLTAEVNDDRDLVIVVDDVGELISTGADPALHELFKTCRRSRAALITAGETSSLTGAWPLLQPIKAMRHGLALTPDQFDGDTVFKTPFPRMNSADFPPGRGLYVRAGRVTKVQVALPLDDTTPGSPPPSLEWRSIG